MKKRRVLFFVIIAGLVGFGWYSGQSKRRRHYQTLDLTKKTPNLFETPEALALSVAGYPNLDKTNPDKIKVLSSDSDQLTYIISANNLLDDSILAREVRVDLVLVDDSWIVDWAGWRQQCRRRLSFGWTKNRCL